MSHLFNIQVEPYTHSGKKRGWGNWFLGKESNDFLLHQNSLAKNRLLQEAYPDPDFNEFAEERRARQKAEEKLANIRARQEGEREQREREQREPEQKTVGPITGATTGGRRSVRRRRSRSMRRSNRSNRRNRTSTRRR